MHLCTCHAADGGERGAAMLVNDAALMSYVIEV